MTTIIPWPDGVPSCVMPMSPQGGLRDNRLSFETDDAVTPVERPRTSWAPELYQVTMVPMDRAMFQAFQEWFRGPLAYGSLPFVMDHPITREPTVWRIVKGDPPYQVSKVLAMRSADVRGISVSFGIQSMPLAVPPPPPPFSPADLFANGEHGAWFDPSDLSSMFQDAAGTIPAVVGQPVGLILDKSGNGNHASQATATARPTLMQDGGGRAYLSFDGVDDFMVTGIVDFSVTDEMLVVAGAHKLNLAGTVSPVILNGDLGTTTGSFALYAPHTATRQYGWSIGGGSQNFRAVDNGLAAPHTAVQSLLSKISSADPDARITPRLNGITQTAFSANLGGSATPAFSADTIRIGKQVITYFKGSIYSLIVRGKLPTGGELAGAEHHVAQKTGVTL